LGELKGKSMKSGIYKISNIINNHCYIGSAVDINGRWRTHKSNLKNGIHHSIYLQRAWDKYGEYNFEFSILEKCEDNKLIEREQFYFDGINPEYNICKVAGSCLGVKFSKESCIKKSLNHAFKGKYGKNHPSSKIIYQYDETGKFIKSWENAVQIQNELGYDSSNIRKSIKYRWMFYSYFWSYVDYGDFYEDVPIKNNREKTKKPILQYSLDGVLLKEWCSAKEATKYLGVKEGNLSGNLRNKTKTAYGYIWKYKKNM
jgi:group I intron endonuclease